jgi:hypothetical protein
MALYFALARCGSGTWIYNCHVATVPSGQYRYYDCVQFRLWTPK